MLKETLEGYRGSSFRRICSFDFGGMRTKGMRTFFFNFNLKKNYI